MPRFWNNKVVVGKEELIPGWFNSYDALAQTLYRSEKRGYGPKRVQYGGNKRELFIDFDTLPKHIQESLGDPRKAEHPVLQFYKIDHAAVDFYQTFKRPGIGLMKPEEFERYIVNASVCQALIKLEQARIQERISKGGSVRASKNVRSVPETILVDAITFNEVLRQKFNTQHNLPTHPRHFRRVFNDFKSNKYISLIKDPEGNSIKNAQKVCENTIKLLNSMFATQDHKPTATEVFNQFDAFLAGYITIINNASGEIYEPSQFPKISKSTVKAYLNQWQNKIATHGKRSGNRQNFIAQFIPHHSMVQEKYAGSIISIDDRQPPFKYPEGKSGKRAWAYMGFDLASGAIVSWVFGKSKEGIITDFYRQLVRNYHDWNLNLPWELECESSLNSSYKETLLKPGNMFQEVRIEANNARGKKVERLFGKLRYEVEKEREGWLARPTAKSESNQASSADVPLIDYSRIVDECLNDIVTWNNTQHHENKSESRWDYFMANQHPELKPTNYKRILPFIGYKTETSCNAGMINFRNTKFLISVDNQIASGEELIDGMKKIEGKEIDIYWLDSNQGDIIKAMITLRGSQEVICDAMAQPMSKRSKLESTEEHREARSIMSKYERTVIAFYQSQKATIDPVTIIDQRPKMINTNFQLPGTTPKPSTEDYFNDELDDFDDDEDLVPVEKTSTPRPLKYRF